MSESTRLKLDARLRELLGSGEVYFQPGSKTTMKYPCVVYKRNPQGTKFANNKPYIYSEIYDITLMYKDGISNLPEKFGRELECAGVDNSWASDGVYHVAYKCNANHI